MGKLYYFCLFIVCLCIIYLAQLPEYRGINVVFIPAFILTLNGFIYQKTKKNIYAYLAMIGFAVFVPIGMVGIVAMRQQMDKEQHRKFKRRLDNE